jgi:dihydrodipicolinate reductase
VNLQRKSKSAIESKASDSHVLTQAAQVSTDKTPGNSHHNAVRSDDIVAEDTVVFYDRPHRPGSSKIAAQAPSRKYSDQN